MRALLPLLLAGCTAQAGIPGWSSGAAPSAAGGGTHTADSTLAQCQALTPSEGDTCSPTDSPYHLLCRADGTWSYRYPGIGWDVTLPPSSSWTAYGSGSVAAANGGRVLTIPAETPTAWRGEYRARPSDPTITSYCVDAVFAVPYSAGSSNNVGLVFTDGVGIAIGDARGNSSMNAARFTSSADLSGTSDATVAGYVPDRLVGLRIAEDATERHFYALDLDAANTADEIGGGYGRTVTITATSVGWVSLGVDADMVRRIRLIHWATSSCTP